nr:hypothetical protein [Acidobacteriota bacterium]
MKRTTLATTFLSAALITTLVPVARPAAATSQSDASPVTARGDWTADARNWGSSDEGPRLQLNLRSIEGFNNWGFGVLLSELEGLPPAAHTGAVNDARFSWAKEAGMFRFQGTFDNGRGSGSFTFSANASYVSGMALLGYRSLSTDTLLRLAVLDVTHAYVRSLGDAGHKSIDLDELVRMRIHRVSAEFIRDFATLGRRGLTTSELIKLRIHGATPEFERAMQAAGFKGLTTDELVKFRIHGVTPDFVTRMAALGYRDLDREHLVKFRIHKVTPEF